MKKTFVITVEIDEDSFIDLSTRNWQGEEMTEQKSEHISSKGVVGGFREFLPTLKEDWYADIIRPAVNKAICINKDQYDRNTGGLHIPLHVMEALENSTISGEQIFALLCLTVSKEVENFHNMMKDPLSILKMFEEKSNE